MRLVEHYIQTIQRVYPDLLITSATLNNMGQNNDVLVINDSFIFRFPKYAAGLQQLAREAAILQGIQGYVTLDVPQPTFINLESQTVGEAFVGYQLIPGEPLWPEMIQSIRDAAMLDALAAQLGTFLRELHSVPTATAIAYPLSVQDTAAEWTDILARIQAKVFPFMRPDARIQVLHDFEIFLQELQHWTYTPVLKHGDFGGSNILFDAQKRTIRGIIDFGSSGLGDPAYDIAGLLSYGESFVHRLAATYPHLDEVWQRATFYKGTFALLEALFGIENDDNEAFENGIESYR